MFTKSKATKVIYNRYTTILPRGLNAKAFQLYLLLIYEGRENGERIPLNLESFLGRKTLLVLRVKNNIFPMFHVVSKNLNSENVL
jgi:hypothetical protein